MNSFISYNTNYTIQNSVSGLAGSARISRVSGGKFGSGGNTRSFAYTWSRAVHGNGGDAVLNMGLGAVNYVRSTDIKKNLKIGFEGLGTFSAAVLFSSSIDPHLLFTPIMYTVGTIGGVISLGGLYILKEATPIDVGVNVVIDATSSCIRPKIAGETFNYGAKQIYEICK